jgi:hypothetical protein
LQCSIAPFCRKADFFSHAGERKCLRHIALAVLEQLRPAPETTGNVEYLRQVHATRGEALTFAGGIKQQGSPMQEMQDKCDPLDTTFYDRVIQTEIGRALKARYDLSHPIPNRFFTLLIQLNEPQHEPDRK